MTGAGVGVAGGALPLVEAEVPARWRRRRRCWGWAAARVVMTRLTVLVASTCTLIIDPEMTRVTQRTFDNGKYERLIPTS